MVAMARWAPARGDVIGEYADEVLQLFPAGRVLVGVDGIDGAGRTSFAGDLVGALQERAVSSAVVSMNDFLAPRSVRHAPPDDAEHWYGHAFDHELVRRLVVQPYRRGEAVALQGFDHERDEPVERPDRFQPAERAVLVVEGIFLHRPELRGLWHSSAWLDVPREVARQRCVQRDGRDPSRDAPRHRVRFPAEDLYLRRVDPRKAANATFDLTDAARPRRVFADAC